MQENTHTLAIRRSKKVNRIAYSLCLLMAAYLLITKQYDWAVINLGIGLIFDPFDATVTWNNRPLYQKAWLIAHLISVFAGFGLMMFL